MKTLGHHTCCNDGGIDYVAENAPFRSEYSPKNNKYPFLGTGYYFWDDNLLMAKYWGKVHYKNQYYVVRARISCRDSDLLDLVGNRVQLREFREMARELVKISPKVKKWTIGHQIELLKRLAKERGKAFFDFKVIKAVDNSIRRKQKFWRFVITRENYTNLDPRIIICILDINEINLRVLNVIDPLL